MRAAPRTQRTDRLAWTTTRRGRAVSAVLAVTTGFSGAAAVDALLLSPPAVAEVTDFGGDGDGLTRYVVAADGSRVTDAQLAALEAVPGVAHAQRLFDGSALVATEDLAAADLAGVVPAAEVTLSVPGEVFAEPITDPAWASYGYNLSNTGSNAYAQTAVAGADVAAPQGWQAGTGAGLVVAVADTGMLTSHPDLQGSLWTNPDQPCGTTDTDGNGLAGDCNGWNFYRASADVTNGGDNAHGTSVAGAVGARLGNGQGTAGVAPGVTIMPLVVGSGSSVDLYAGAQAIRYAADNGADVVNASWGGGSGASILAAAIEYANSKGTVVVAAAGNDSRDRDAYPMYPASLGGDNMITVGSSTAADTMSSFSAYGDATVELFAPGELVFTTTYDGRYNVVSGTSIAAPQVAAAIALYKGVLPGASAAELKAALLADVQPVPAFAGRSVTGGRLSLVELGNSAAAVQYSFSAMAGEPGEVTPSVALSGPAGPGSYDVRLLLGMEHDGEIMAVSGQTVVVDGAELTTDDSGEVVVPLGARNDLGSVVVRPGMTLEAGRYVLIAQVLRDGSALTAPHAAPLLVGQDAVAPAPTPGTPVEPDPGTSPTPGEPTPDEPAPGEPTPAPAPGTDEPAPGNEGPGEEPTESPGGTDPGSEPGAGSDPAPGDGDEPAPGEGSPTPTEPIDAPAPEEPVAPNPVAPAEPIDGGTEPGDDQSPPAESPDEEPPAEDGSDPSSPDPDLGGENEYPEVGPFELTSISPARVSTDGGTLVTIEGNAIPDGALVRIGDTTSVPVDSLTATRLTFTTPSLVAGTYDVYVFAPDRTTVSRLADALTFVDVDAGEEPVGDGPAPGDDPGTGLPPDPAENQEPDDTPEQVVTGPGGQRLVSSSLFRSVPRSIWDVDCSTACSGVPL